MLTILIHLIKHCENGGVILPLFDAKLDFD